MSGTSNITIRKATKQDVPLILGFIRKKAAFDGVLHRVEATEEKLAGELFGSRPVAFVPERIKKYCSHSGKSRKEAVFLGFGFVLAQLQGFQTCAFAKGR